MNAVPGAGKSTLSYLIATKLKDKSILSITYSKSLKMESRLKKDELHIDNIVIHSYHSFAMKYYKLPYSNSLIKDALKKNKKLYYKESIDLLILDEIQDMTHDIYKLIKKYIFDYNQIHDNPFQILVLGDNDQAIFDFTGADFRFLTLADKIFGGDFIKSYLTESYRLTAPISQFVNQNLLGFNKIKTNKSGEKVKYIIANNYF